MVNISNSLLLEEKNNLKNAPILDLINYIRESFHISIKIKAQEEIDKFIEKSGKNIHGENAAEDYETLLRKEEAEIRQHISIEHQFKLHLDNFMDKISELEKDNYYLAKKIEKQKKKYDKQIKDMENQLSFIKEQKNNYKISEKNLRKKLNLKEKEINDLKTILNTNISIKSQISSINHDIKDEDNPKEIKEIIPYNDSLNINKHFYRPKSLTLIERKSSSYNSRIRRNLLKKNITNKSYNSKNISKKKIKNINKPKNDYKYKTISNIFSGNNSKKIKENNSIKIINNYIKPFFFCNYNSINSIKGKKLDKSESRSFISRKARTKSKIKIPEESKSVNKSNKANKDNEKTLINNNKILINYNTNIINTNVSIDKIAIRQKIKEIRKSIDEKMGEITRNKKYNIRRTISVIYGKRNKFPFFNEKIKTKREFLLRCNEKKINRNKLDNKLKFKNKNNSMFNIKNENSKNKDKKFVIQSNTGKKSGGNIQLYKDKEIKSKKNTSFKNLNNKFQMSKKNLNIENSRTIINNLHKSRLSFKKNNNFGKINISKDRINKNDNKAKKNCYIYNRNNKKTTSSLRKYIFNKYISNSKPG